jgi:PAS domain S-box-containing protein
MTEQLEDVVTLSDRDSLRVLYVNPAYEVMFRRSGESLCERMDSFLDSIHPDDRVIGERMLENQRNGRHAPVEYRIVWPDKSERWISHRSFPIRNTEGEVYLVAGIAQDITDRKRAQDSLRESEERYRDLFENARDAIYVHDLGGRYTSLNRAAEKLSGYRRDEIIGKHFSNFVSPRDLKHVRTNLCKKLDVESETTYEVELVTKDRRRVPVEVVSRLIYSHGQPVGVQGTVRDITERKSAQESLQVYSRSLIEAQETERQSLAQDLHDQIGQALTTVRSNLHDVESSCENDTAVLRLKESITLLDEAIGRISDPNEVREN